ELLRDVAQERFVALGLGQLEQLGQRHQRLIARPPVLDGALGALQRRDGLLRLVGSIPESGLREPGLELLHLARAYVDVKGTSAGCRATRAPDRNACEDRRWSACPGLP